MSKIKTAQVFHSTNPDLLGRDLPDRPQDLVKGTLDYLLWRSWVHGYRIDRSPGEDLSRAWPRFVQWRTAMLADS